MTAVNAAKYYAAHKDEEKEYVPISVAHEVHAGDDITIDMGILIATTADEDGYEMSDGVFMTKAELEEQTTSAEDWELPVPKQDLSAEDLASITPVKKGSSALISTVEGINIQASIDEDGFLIKTDEGKQFYMSNFELTSEFNYNGPKYETQKELHVVRNDATPMKGIILQEDVTFDFKAGEYTAPAGSLLFVNPDDEDGYTAETLERGSPNTELRVTERATAQQKAHETAVSNQDHLRNLPRFKLK